VAVFLEVPGALSSSECDGLLETAASHPAREAAVLGTGGYAPDPEIRLAKTTSLDRPDAPWMFERLDALFADAARQFGLDVGRVTEPLQIVRYAVGGHFYQWHSDAGGDLQDRRRVSMSIELSPADGYEGGLLEIVPARMGVIRTSPRGTATLFPSRALHRVTPVTSGERLSLVAWTGG
jgi:PKHD-type hydroxylase